MKYQYKIIYVKTIKEIEKAEKLQAMGWKPINISMANNRLLLEKELNK